jgi:hypothetical protein
MLMGYGGVDDYAADDVHDLADVGVATHLKTPAFLLFLGWSSLGSEHYLYVPFTVVFVVSASAGYLSVLVLHINHVTIAL